MELSVRETINDIKNYFQQNSNASIQKAAQALQRSKPMYGNLEDDKWNV